MWDYENSVFLLCFCLLWEVWAGTFEGLFIPVILIFIKSLKVESLRCCFYTCTRLSSNMPFSLSAVEVFPTCLSSVLWSMYCLSSPQPSRWKSPGYSGNHCYCSLFRRLQLLQTLGFYKALFTTSDEGEVNTHDSHRLTWPGHDRGLCFHNHPVSYTNENVTVFFSSSFNLWCFLDILWIFLYIFTYWWRSYVSSSY